MVQLILCIKEQCFAVPRHIYVFLITSIVSRVYYVFQYMTFNVWKALIFFKINWLAFAQECFAVLLEQSS